MSNCKPRKKDQGKWKQKTHHTMHHPFPHVQILRGDSQWDAAPLVHHECSKQIKFIQQVIISIIIGSLKKEFLKNKVINTNLIIGTPKAVEVSWGQLQPNNVTK